MSSCHQKRTGEKNIREVVINHPNWIEVGNMFLDILSALYCFLGSELYCFYAFVL